MCRTRSVRYYYVSRATLKGNFDETVQSGTTANAAHVFVGHPTRAQVHTNRWLSFGRTLINPLLNPMDTPRLILSVRRMHTPSTTAQHYMKRHCPRPSVPYVQCTHSVYRHIYSYTR